MSASILVKVPRDLVHDYCARPWATVIAAAERHEDGLSVERPKWTPMRADPPIRASYIGVDGIEDTPRYEKDAAAVRQRHESRVSPRR